MQQRRADSHFRLDSLEAHSEALGACSSNCVVGSSLLSLAHASMTRADG